LNASTLEDFRWLVSDAAVPWLAAAREGIKHDGQASVGLISRLRKDLSAARAHLVVEQVDLRRRAREKFSLAERMFFSRKGLEQATDEFIAHYKAGRFARGERVADLCCGIGGDLIGLARRGPVEGVELDAAAALFARANLNVSDADLSVSSIDVLNATAFDLDRVGGWHCDPDRRAEGRRTTRIETYQPSLESLTKMLSRNPHAAIKLAPAAKAPDHWRETTELEWIGSRGECRQQVAWFGALARQPGKHAASVVDAPNAARTVIGAPHEPIPVAARLGLFVYEPHAAVLAAQLTGALCRELSLESVSAAPGYLTGDRAMFDPLLATFEVIDALPLDRKQLKAYCREHQIGRLEVKKRGVDIEPEGLRREIVGKGDESATVIVVRMETSVRAIVTKRVSSGAHGAGY
jgi:hypothetical protein